MNSLIFFILSAIYLAPHMDAWVGIPLGFLLMIFGFYALHKENKRHKEENK